MTDEELKRMLKEHREEFGEFQDDWTEHRREAKEAMRKVDMIQSSMSSIAPNIAHLGQLPLIASTLASIDRGHASQIQQLITQTGAAGKSSSRIVEKMLLVCSLVVLFLGVALVVLFIRDSNKDVRVGKDGMQITTSSGGTASADNKKTPEAVP